MRRAVLALALAACGRVDFDPRGDGGFTMPPPAPGMGSGSISAIAGCDTTMPFDTVVAAYSIGHVEQPGGTEIVLIDHAIACDANGIGLASWDSLSTELTAPTQAIGFVIGSQESGTYAVSYVDPPAAGTAFAIYYAMSRPDGGTESSCIAEPNGGTMTVTMNAGGSIDGTFDVAMQGSMMWMAAGGFHAVACAIGVAPSFN